MASILGEKIIKAANNLKKDTGNKTQMKKKILTHKKLANRFWTEVKKVQSRSGFQEEFGGRDIEDYEAWEEVSGEAGEEFVRKYVLGEEIENIYEKYGVKIL